MSPEQVRSQPDIDARTDLYSLSAVLYELLSGVKPHAGNNYVALTYDILNVDPDPLDCPRFGIPTGLSRIVAKGLSRDRAERYGSVAEFAQELERFDTPRARGSQVDADRTRFSPVDTTSASALENSTPSSALGSTGTAEPYAPPKDEPLDSRDSSTLAAVSQGSRLAPPRQESDIDAPADSATSTDADSSLAPSTQEPDKVLTAPPMRSRVGRVVGVSGTMVLAAIVTAVLTVAIVFGYFKSKGTSAMVAVTAAAEALAVNSASGAQPTSSATPNAAVSSAITSLPNAVVLDIDQMASDAGINSGATPHAVSPSSKPVASNGALIANGPAAVANPTKQAATSLSNKPTHAQGNAADSVHPKTAPPANPQNCDPFGTPSGIKTCPPSK